MTEPSVSGNRRTRTKSFLLVVPGLMLIIMSGVIAFLATVDSDDDEDTGTTHTEIPVLATVGSTSTVEPRSTLATSTVEPRSTLATTTRAVPTPVTDYPGKPSGLELLPEGESDRVVANWTKPTDGGTGIRGYEIGISRSPDKGSLEAVGSTNPDLMTYTIRSLEKGAEYWIAVRAWNDWGFGPWSDTRPVISQPEVPATTRSPATTRPPATTVAPTTTTTTTVAPTTAMDYSFGILDYADFSNRGDLSESKFISTTLISVDFFLSILIEADFTDATFSDVNFSYADLTGANLSNVTFDEDSDLSRANLTGADLSGADLSGANIVGSTLTGANFSDVILREANLGLANLDGVDLTGVDLTGVNLVNALLRNANLSGASLVGATLREAVLTSANLSYADLSLADLISADFQLANLIGANLIGANLFGANLFGANLFGANLEGAFADGNTVWSGDFDPEAAGVIFD